MLDGVSYLTEAVVNAGTQPTKILTSWVADKIAPSYWRPNNEIKVAWFTYFMYILKNYYGQI